MKKRIILLLAFLLPTITFGQTKFTKNWNSTSHAYINSLIEHAVTTDVIVNVDSASLVFWIQSGGFNWNISMFDSNGVKVWAVDSTGKTLSASSLPRITDTYDLGSPLFTWDSLFIGDIYLSSGLTPSVSGAIDIGSASAELGDVYLADDKKLYFGNDQDVSIKYNENGNDNLSIAGANITLNGNYLTNTQNITDLGGAGCSYSFDGVDDYVSIADDGNLDFGTDDFSIFLSGVIPASISGTQYLINKESGGIGYGLYMVDDDLYIRFDDNTTDASGIIGTACFSTGAIHKILVIFDRDGNATAYINGDIVGTVDISSANLTLDNAGALRLGSTTAGANFYNGQITEKRLYNRILSADEINARYSGAETEAKYANASTVNNITDSNNRNFANGSINDWAVSTDGNGTCIYNAGPAGEKVGKVIVGTTPGTHTDGRLLAAYSTDFIIGQRYLIQADVYLSSSSNNFTLIRMAPSFAGSDYVFSNAVLTTEDTWQTISLLVTMQSTSSTINIQGYSTTAGGCFCFDNVSITAVGEVAKYRPSEMTPTIWYNASGNENNATISGATLVNAPTFHYINGDRQQKVYSSNVSNPPTDAELDALFTSPATKGDGWTCYIDDFDSANFYQIVASGSLWFILTATKAL